MLLLPVDIPAVDHFGLIGMKFQATVFQPALQPFPDGACLLQAVAMDESVIGVSAKGDARKVSRHPPVERIMKEQVRQQRREDAPNTKGNFRFERQIVAWRNRLLVELRRKR